MGNQCKLWLLHISLLSIAIALYWIFVRLKKDFTNITIKIEFFDAWTQANWISFSPPLEMLKIWKQRKAKRFCFGIFEFFFFCFDESKEMLPFAQNILTDAALLWIRFAVVAIGKWTSVFIRYCFTVRIYGGEYEFIIFMRHIVQFYYSLSDENHSKKCLLWGFNN